MNMEKPEDCDLSDLQKNLEEDLKRFSQNSYNSLQDFVPFNESIIWDFSYKYYQSKGILAWSNNAPKIIPHKAGTNYQNALAFAKIIQANIENYPSEDKVNILEAGSGSGRFSRHLLFAFRELNIASQVKLIISDYSNVNLESIRRTKVLESFSEGEDYELVYFDLLKPRSLLGSFRAVFMHYVLDALPLTILKNTDSKFQELLISSKIRAEQETDVLENDFLQSRIIHEDRWQDYEPDLLLEQKYWDFFSDYHKEPSNKELYYSYNSFAAIENLIELLDDNGFILSTDVIPGGEKRYIVVGNSLALEVDNHIIKSLVEANGYKALVQDESSVSRLLISKKLSVLKKLTKTFEQVFIENNLIHEYIELEKAIEEALEQRQIDDLEVKLNRLLCLAPQYAFSYELYHNYLKLKNKPELAKEYLTKARAMDYWQDLRTP